MAMRKTSRYYIPLRLEECVGEPTRIEGFVPIVPERKEFVGDLEKIIDANRGSSREHSKSCWIPYAEDYKKHRDTLSSAIRRSAETTLGGYFAPITGNDLLLELEVVLPAKKTRKMYRAQDIVGTFCDAMLFNAWTTDGRRLGLVAENASLADVVLSKRDAKDGEESGTRFVVCHQGEYSDDGMTNTPDGTSDGSMMSGGRTGDLGADREVALLLTCFADENTPLHPEILRYYHLLRYRFCERTAERVALYEQTRYAVACVEHGHEAGEKVIGEVGKRIETLSALSERSLSLADLRAED